MGGYQSTNRILIQDGGICDAFVRKYLDQKDIKYNHYICGKKDDLTSDRLSLNNRLMKSMGLTDILEVQSIVMDNTKEIVNFDTCTLTTQVKQNMEECVKTDDLELIINSYATPMLNIFAELIRSKFLTPVNVKINLIVHNVKSNDADFYKVLSEFDSLLNDLQIKLDINTFNAFNSVDRGSKTWSNCENVTRCSTSQEFGKLLCENMKKKQETTESDEYNEDTQEFKETTEIKQELIKESEEVKEEKLTEVLAEYCVFLHKPLIGRMHRMIKHAVDTFESLGCPIYDVKYVFHNTNVYIPNIIENGVVDTSLCKRLVNDIKIIIDKSASEMKKLDDATSIKDSAKKFIKDKLYHINNWFSTKTHIIENNLMYFPLANMAQILLHEADPTLDKHMAYGIEKKKFFNIVKDVRNISTKDEDDIIVNNFIQINHYVSNNPPETVKKLEEFITRHF